MNNKEQFNQIVTLVNDDLKALDYDDKTISSINMLMTEILVHLAFDIGMAETDILFHKTTAQTFRSLANMIDLICEHKNVKTNNP